MGCKPLSVVSGAASVSDTRDVSRHLPRLQAEANMKGGDAMRHPPRSGASAFRQGAEAERRAAIRRVRHAFISLPSESRDEICVYLLNALALAPLPRPPKRRARRET